MWVPYVFSHESEKWQCFSCHMSHTPLITACFDHVLQRIPGGRGAMAQTYRDRDSYNFSRGHVTKNQQETIILTRKPTQHCWSTTPQIVGCYMLRPFALSFACCWMLLRVVAQGLKPVKLLAPCKRTQHCLELLRAFARSLRERIPMPHDNYLKSI